MADEKRYVPIAYKKGTRAYARNPKPHLPNEAELRSHAHAFQHEAGQLFRVTEAQAQHSLSLADTIKRAVSDGLKAHIERLSLTDMQAQGLAINIGWSLIVATVDQLRREHDPLSRVAYMAELLRHLQTRTWTSTEERIYDHIGDGDYEKGLEKFPELDTHATQMLHHVLDNDTLGDYAKAYDHARKIGTGHGLGSETLNLLREALGVPPADEAAPVADDAIELPPELAGIGGLSGLGALLQALDKIPRAEPKPAAPVRPKGRISDGKGMLAIEIRAGEGPKEFHARLVKELTDKGMDEANAIEMATAVVEHIAKGLDDNEEGDDD